MTSRWQQLIAQVRSDLPRLVDDFMDRVMALEAYRDGSVSLSDVRADATEAFSYLLGQLADPADRLCGADAIRAGRRLGQGRARVGVPLSDLLTAVRLDFHVLWASIRRHAEASDQALLIDGVETIWGVVEGYSSDVQIGYLEELSRMTDKRLSDRSRLLTAVIERGERSTEVIQELGEALEVPIDGQFVAVATEIARDHELRQVATQLVASGNKACIYVGEQHSLLVTDWRSEDTDPLRKLLKHTSAAIGPVVGGLAELARTCKLAVELYECSRSTVRSWPVELKDVWIPFLSTRLVEAAPEFAQSITAGIRGLPEKELKVLLQVAVEYASSGSMSEVATRLYCHRNTILNRLRRIRTLTGLDLTVPTRSVLFLIAVHDLLD
ncbi:PucR family transcriptional regulator [Amycolatopsis methanolica]|uniref:PucR family transcriptional regulator n=1 Tax=Amycolatopsis methanolica TaxID=1814 RepID=UPI003448519A